MAPLRATAAVSTRQASWQTARFFAVDRAGACYVGVVFQRPALRYRIVGTVCLLLAMGMLAGDATWLKSRLTDAAFLSYWLLCFLFTAVAIGCAVLDARTLRRRTRDEQRALLERTLQEIQQAKTRQSREAAPQPRSRP